MELPSLSLSHTHTHTPQTNGFFHSYCLNVRAIFLTFFLSACLFLIHFLLTFPLSLSLSLTHFLSLSHFFCSFNNTMDCWDVVTWTVRPEIPKGIHFLRIHFWRIPISLTLLSFSIIAINVNEMYCLPHRSLSHYIPLK
jgi:hypothetical protein